MLTMKTVQTSRSGVIEVVEVERPVPGSRNVLMRVRACGICGTDATFVHLGSTTPSPVTTNAVCTTRR